MLRMIWHGLRVSLTASVFWLVIPINHACPLHARCFLLMCTAGLVEIINSTLSALGQMLRMYVRMGIYMAHCLSCCKGAINFHNTIIIYPCINFHNDDIIAMNYVPLYKINNTGMHYNHEHIGMHMVSIIL